MFPPSVRPLALALVLLTVAALLAGPSAAALAAPSRGPTVSAALARLVRAGTLPAAEARAHVAALVRARAARAALRGRGRTELGAVVADLERLARAGRLSASRVPAAFLTLRRNTEYWPRGLTPSLPTPDVDPVIGSTGLGGARVVFRDDPLVFQWYPGQGLRIQWLANAGRANALAAPCLPGASRRAGRCRPEELRALLDRFVALAVDRGGFLAWEYDFAFGGGRPPWISAMAQATAMQALVRGSTILSEPRHRSTARRALGAFTRRPPSGVRLPVRGGGDHFLLYSSLPGLRVFNGFLQALVGLFDVAQATGDPAVLARFAAGDRQARRELPFADTGAWSRYSLGGRESDLGYHRLTRDILRNLCTRTSAPAYCATAGRFSRYLTEPAVARIVSVAPLRARSRASIRLALSKLAVVTVTATRDGGAPRTVWSGALAGGTRTLLWRPALPGAHSLLVETRDLTGQLFDAEALVRVRPPARARPAAR